MPASRWNTDLMVLLSWFKEDDITLEDFLLSPIVTRVGGDEDGLEGEIDTLQDTDQVPDVLPILPLRGLVVYPETAVPLTIGQPRSIRLIDDVVSEDNR
ncbi:MAG: LON peptidase substrate-binding domain-containing protein, partial [Chloroflexi bacterium]|nr:LON peptidase substrate-binding domain-containing protein [Chloroflexota bacterium]